jgi:HopA1 effector protein family
VAYEPPHSSAVLAGGQDGTRLPDESVVSQRPAAGALLRGPAAGPWPEWTVPQLRAAVALAATADDRMSVAGLLYRNWFNPETGDTRGLPAGTPLAGLYRAAHAGSGTRMRRGSLSVVARHDVLRAGGWWRTWGEHWTPPRGRSGSVRLMLTPRPDCLAEFVTTVTGRMLTARTPWSLACSTDPWRLARVGCALLDLPGLDAVPNDLLAELEPMLRPITPPLCLPLAPGVGAAEYPDNGMTFGEHRCHLVALGLRHRRRSRDPLSTIAGVFSTYGIDPAQPHRSS